MMVMTVPVRMPVGLVVMTVFVRHAASMNFDSDLYSAGRFEYYHSDTAISSSTSGPPPTGNTMNCLPPAM